jgi:hypothetical protein
VDQVELLRRRRGDQKISFADVADHLADFAQNHPEYSAVMERLAEFLVEVEDEHHHHDEVRGAGSDATG